MGAILSRRTAINGSDRNLSFILPKTEGDATWTLVINTRDTRPRPGQVVASEGYCELGERSIAVFRTPSGSETEREPDIL